MENKEILIQMLTDIAYETCNMIARESDRNNMDRDYVAERFAVGFASLIASGTFKGWKTEDNHG